MIDNTWSKFQEFTLRICFDPGTLHRSRSGSITGVVYFEFSPGRQFRSLGWNDFVVVLASWWMVALKEIIEGHSPMVKRRVTPQPVIGPRCADPVGSNLP